MSYSKELENLVDHFFITNAAITKKKEMGGVGWLIKGNFCCGVYENLLVVRMEQDIADMILEKPGVDYFDRDQDKGEIFISLSKNIYEHSKALGKFLSHSYKLANALPPKNQDRASGTE